MRRLIFLFSLISILISCKNETPKVLIYAEDGSAKLAYMLKHEVGKMTEILTQSGIKVIVATVSGEILKTDSISLTPDLKLRDVNISDYNGVIMPCMATGDSIVTPEETTFAKNVVNAGKPIAAQLGAVLILAKAGLLNGKKFAFADEKDINPNMVPYFNGGIYSGRGVVQDGLIITSGTCPWMAKVMGYKDGTDELTKTLIKAIKARVK